MMYNKDMENLPTTVYQSPRTGTEYLIVPQTDSRAYFENGQQLWAESTIYHIVLNGNPVQFALSEEGIPASVEQFENPGPDLGSRFD
jgi:hypothetical protein